MHLVQMESLIEELEGKRDKLERLGTEQWSEKKREELSKEQ